MTLKARALFSMTGPLCLLTIQNRLGTYTPSTTMWRCMRCKKKILKTKNTELWKVIDKPESSSPKCWCYYLNFQVNSDHNIMLGMILKANVYYIPGISCFESYMDEYESYVSLLCMCVCVCMCVCLSGPQVRADPVQRPRGGAGPHGRGPPLPVLGEGEPCAAGPWIWRAPAGRTQLLQLRHQGKDSLHTHCSVSLLAHRFQSQRPCLPPA
jgi:hypothetical protein